MKAASAEASPEQLLNKLLNKYSQWPIEGHWGVSPTLEGLCDALRRRIVGLGDVANELSTKGSELPSKQLQCSQ